MNGEEQSEALMQGFVPLPIVDGPTRSLAFMSALVWSIVSSHHLPSSIPFVHWTRRNRLQLLLLFFS
jgi:hypothetical protein